MKGLMTPDRPTCDGCEPPLIDPLEFLTAASPSFARASFRSDMRADLVREDLATARANRRKPRAGRLRSSAQDHRCRVTSAPGGTSS
jgi:hypothetical protein